MTLPFSFSLQPFANVSCAADAAAPPLPAQGFPTHLFLHNLAQRDVPTPRFSVCNTSGRLNPPPPQLSCRTRWEIRLTRTLGFPTFSSAFFTSSAFMMICLSGTTFDTRVIPRCQIAFREASCGSVSARAVRNGWREPAQPAVIRQCDLKIALEHIIRTQSAGFAQVAFSAAHSALRTQCASPCRPRALTRRPPA